MAGTLRCDSFRNVGISIAGVPILASLRINKQENEDGGSKRNLLGPHNTKNRNLRKTLHCRISNPSPWGDQRGFEHVLLDPKRLPCPFQPVLGVSTDPNT